VDWLSPFWISYLGFGVLFTIAYLDPDTTVARKSGTGEPKRDPVLLVLGV
jgi:hypothetical protein